MILGLSSSSPFAVAALLHDDFSLVEEASERSDRNASGLLISMTTALLRSHQAELGELSGVLVDRGPGGFTGVKIALTLGKAIAWSRGLKLYAAASFDLIDSNGAVSVPFKTGTFIVRVPNEEPYVADSFVGLGYGGPGPERYPSFTRLGPVDSVDPMRIVPLYVAPPSISTPKQRPGI